VRRGFRGNPLSVSRIGGSAFRADPNLTEISIPSRLADIERSVFRDVTKLEPLTLLCSPLSEAMAHTLISA
jgi:hypothetical protein